MNDAKRHAPATLRNREVIADVLAKELPSTGTVLEVASGSGEHAVYFAERLPHLIWQPSDFQEEALASIIAWQSEQGGANLKWPTVIDAAKPENWEVRSADAIFCANMVHIAPWSVTEGLFQGAGRLLATGAPLILYGPYYEDGVEPAPSNLAFDESLKARDPEWGIRQINAVDALAAQHDFKRTARHEMPANNLTLVYRKN
ncbi:DUF938 domain-containing protein [Altererythrobacter lutimaris]|uniref:DUF938 domain-containing protein n=1 Tax=Altererythrobacter lutimaris TaxID=2743979 RepID=A0A850H627_9SPHN|nr:DUF938 domain-containing protein [Altererythrobacter lutimaris]NVE94597.1 DUF938 domain-containing protein [Altererythrobacter lutimaris]